MIGKAKEFFKSQQLETGIKNTYLFLDSKCNYFGSSGVFFRKFQTLLKEVDIEKSPLHTLRHTFASIMLNNGIDPLWVSHTLGHENLQVTLGIYTHFMPKKEKMRIEFLEKRYKKGTNAS
jgi:integrase